MKREGILLLKYVVKKYIVYLKCVALNKIDVMKYEQIPCDLHNIST